MKQLLYIGITIIMIFFKTPAHSNYEKVFYDFSIESIDGEIINLSEYKNKVVLLVNTASYCGFTKQYGDLQALWDKYKSKGLIVFGVPSNSFNQEKDNNNDIKNFCETNFNINFPMIELTSVKGDDAHEIYKWAKAKFGSSTVPKWNFHKILIDKNGLVVDTFAPFTNPMSKKILKEIERLMK